VFDISGGCIYIYMRVCVCTRLLSHQSSHICFICVYLHRLDAGKYVPAFGAYIQTENQQNPSVNVNLAGIAIGDGLTDPITQVTAYADILFNSAIADSRQAANMTKVQNNIVSLIQQEQWHEASEQFSTLVNGPPDMFQTISGCDNYYDLISCHEKSYGGNWNGYIAQAFVREALHVGNNTFGEDGGVAGNALFDDIPKSTAPQLVSLMNSGIKVLLYNGELDFIVAPATTETMLLTLPWNDLEQYKEAPRTIWHPEGHPSNVYGYVRHVNNFYQIIVRDAGHILPGDAPEAAYDMITRFIDNISFSKV
jgi:vitellogenic carboxypeptidase-like protein